MRRNIKQMIPVAIIIGVTFIMSVVLYHKIVEREEENCWQLLEDSAKSVTKEMQITFENDKKVLHLAADMMGKDSDAYDKNELELFRKDTTFSRIDRIYPGDKLKLEDGTEKELRKELSFSQLAEEGEHMSERMKDTETKKDVVYYFVPVSKNGETVAILSGVLESEELVKEFHPAIYNGNASYCIIDSRDGNFIMDAWHDELGNAYTTPDRKRLPQYENVDLKQEVKSQKTGVIAFESRTTGKPLYMYYMPLQMFDWELQVFVPENVVFAKLIYLKQILLYAGVLEALLLILYFLWNLRQVQRLSKSKEETLEQLNISNTLIECVTALSSDNDIDVSIQNLLQIITEYFKADRTYIFEFDPEKNVFINTYEYAGPGVASQMETMPEIPADALARGVKAFQECKVYYIPDIEQEKGYETYEILRGREIQRLLAVPLCEEENITGFVSVDNPRDSYDDATLLSSIQFFISNSLETKSRQEQLKDMSYKDGLTGLYNRNKYIQILTSYEPTQNKSVGVMYLDLNGLKKVNDQQGHEAGDILICNVAKIIDAIYPNEAYRIGGDEFVIVSFDTEQKEFEQKVMMLQEKMIEKHISVSIGALWKEKCDDIEALLKNADECMYEEKKRYYQMKKGTIVRWC